MERWKAAWEIVEGQTICRSCGSRQDMGEAQRPFKHREGCTAAIPARQMPWRDLAALLRTQVLKQ